MARVFRAIFGIKDTPTLEAQINKFNDHVDQSDRTSSDRIQQLRTRMVEAKKQGNSSLARIYATRIIQEEKRIQVTGQSSQAVYASSLAYDNAKMVKQSASLAAKTTQLIMNTALPTPDTISKVSDKLNDVNDRIDESTRAFEDFTQVGANETSHIDEMLQQADDKNRLEAVNEFRSITVPSDEKVSIQSTSTKESLLVEDLPSMTKPRQPPTPSSSSSSPSPTFPPSISGPTQSSLRVPVFTTNAQPPASSSSTDSQPGSASDFLKDLGF
jgi:hypothetical protein